MGGALLGEVIVSSPRVDKDGYLLAVTSYTNSTQILLPLPPSVHSLEP